MSIPCRLLKTPALGVLSTVSVGDGKTTNLFLVSLSMTLVFLFFYSLLLKITKAGFIVVLQRAVMEVLKNYDVFPSVKSSTKKAKTKRMVPSSEQLMQRCRFVLRAVADADKTEAFSILVGGPEGHGAGKLRGMVARPLDFRTIDARLAAGAYGGSVEAFAADVRQVWLDTTYFRSLIGDE